MEEPLFSDNSIAEAQPDELIGFFGNSPQFLIYFLRRTYFKYVVHLVLLFGVETWVVTPHMVWVLGDSSTRWHKAGGENSTAEAVRKVGVHLVGDVKRGVGV